MSIAGELSSVYQKRTETWEHWNRRFLAGARDDSSGGMEMTAFGGERLSIEKGRMEAALIKELR